MRPINLLPPEAFERAKNRRRIAQYILIGIVYVAVLAALVFWWQGRVDTAEDKVEAQQLINRGLEDERNSLSSAEDLVNRYDANVALVGSVLVNDISWGRILNDLGRMLPDRIWLEGFTGAADSTEAALTRGVVSVNGTGFDFPDVSAWLRSLDSDRFPSVAGTWVTSVAESLIGEAAVVTFVSQTSLTDAAASDQVFERIPVITP